MKGHQLRLFAVDQPAVAWITQDDVKSAVIATSNGDKTVMQVSLKPDAEQRMLALTAANVGKTIRYTWDEKVVTDMKVMTSFGGTFQLPMPPS
jgi:preprotein translocase subunit SecD